MTQLFESMKIALAALNANKLRSALTTIGVVIGIFFVLLMGWVLGGLDTALTDSFAFFGDDILYVDRFNWGGGVSWDQQRNRKPIDYNQFERVKQRLHSAEYVVPTTNHFSMDVRHDDLQLQGIRVNGTTNQYIDMFAGNMKEGRFFTDMESQFGANVVVLGYNVDKNLFPNGGSIGQTIRIDGYPFHVIGILPKRGTALMDFVDNVAMIPIKRFFDVFGRRGGVTINVKAGGVEHLEDMRYETIGVMRAVRSLGPDQDNDFGVNSQEMFTDALKQFRFIVWGVGMFMTGLSFLVGSIGIMNIMFVSVTERTKEIGVRKAVGATHRSVLLQFIVESVFLCLVGAGIGLVFTSLIAWFKEPVVNGIISLLALVGMVAPDTSVDLSFLTSTIPLTQVLYAVLVAVVVGVLAGVIPAFRAARLDPVEALRSGG